MTEEKRLYLNVCMNIRSNVDNKNFYVEKGEKRRRIMSLKMEQIGSVEY